jgi:hypothetical protein
MFQHVAYRISLSTIAKMFDEFSGYIVHNESPSLQIVDGPIQRDVSKTASKDLPTNSACG